MGQGLVTGAPRYDAVVIGAGHNGLVAGAYLAKAGRRVLILERRDRVGGILAEAELTPGVRVPAVAHTVGRLRASVIRDLRLGSHGLEMIRPDARVFAPDLDGGALTLWSDPGRTADELRPRSARDAAAYPGFDRRVRAIASFLAYLAAAPPPEVQTPSLADALAGLKLGRAFRRLGPRAGREALRVLPMAVADLVGEAFERDELRGAVASRAVQFTAMGPWTAGTAAVLLADSAGSDGGAAGQTVFARGGPAALAGALASAARAFGAEIRTGAEVAAVTMAGGRSAGVALASGEEITASAVVSGADPKRTLLGLVDPEELGPTLVWRASNIRTPGCTAKVNLALSGRPRFVAEGEDGGQRLRGRIVIAPGIDYLERGADAAKYGRVSAEPYLEATIPSLSDPTLAPEGRHVMSVIAQWAPRRLRGGSWDVEREGLGDLVVKAMEAYAPGLSDLIVARQVLTPEDLERDFALTGGHVLHAEPGLDQFFAWRPLLGFARHRMPIPGLYLCGSGAHPGGGITGAPGANAAREILADLSARRRSAS
jgi:phytoene dehydrogenase-like protein